MEIGIGIDLDTDIGMDTDMDITMDSDVAVSRNLCGCPCNKNPAVLGPMLGPLIFGNYQNGFRALKQGCFKGKPRVPFKAFEAFGLV